MRRREVMALAAGAGLTLPALARAADSGTFRVGVLKFGSVSWELDVVQHNRLDEKEGFTLAVQAYGGNDAADVALMGGGVDGIVEDWLWVSRQRTDGAALTWIPYSSNIGAVMVKDGGPVASLADLRGKRVGVAGGPLDKTWLLLVAYGRDKAGIDLARDASPVYGAPPLLMEKLKSGELDAALNYWQFCAQLEPQGFRRLIEGTAIQEAFGVPARTPQLGYVFKEELGRKSPGLIDAFARATREARRIMADSDEEWRRLRPLTRVEDDAAFAALVRRYREGLILAWGEGERHAAAELYDVLARVGGEKLVGKGDRLAAGTFWPNLSY